MLAMLQWFSWMWSFKGLFRDLPNIKDSAFRENHERLKAVNYFCRKLHLRCLTRLGIHLWHLHLLYPHRSSINLSHNFRTLLCKSFFSFLLFLCTIKWNAVIVYYIWKNTYDWMVMVWVLQLSLVIVFIWSILNFFLLSQLEKTTSVSRECFDILISRILQPSVTDPLVNIHLVCTHNIPNN